MLLACGPVAVAWAAHRSITKNFFVTDDFLHLYHIQNEPLLEFLVTPHGGHLLILRNLLFALSRAAFGLDPGPYMWSALLTHLVNTLLFYWVLRVQTGERILASLGALLFGACVVHRGSLGWYSVYGHVLAGTLLLAAIGLISWERTRELRASWVAAMALLVACATCFGTGLGVAMAFACVAHLLLPSGRSRRLGTLVFASLTLIVPSLYFGARWIYRQYDAPISPLLDPRTLVEQWPETIAAFGELAAFGTSSFFRGADPVVEDVALAGLAAASAFWVPLVLVVPLLRPNLRRGVAAWTIVMAACYAIIVLGRLGGWLRNEQASDFGAAHPRYHYLAQLGICGAFTCAATSFRRLPRRAHAAALAVLAGLSLWVASEHLRLARTIPPERGAEQEFESALSAMDREIRNAPTDTVCIPNRPFSAVSRSARRRPELLPGWAALFVIAHGSNLVDGKRVTFLETNPSILAFVAAQEGHVIRELVVDRCPEDDSAALRQGR